MLSSAPDFSPPSSPSAPLASPPLPPPRTPLSLAPTNGVSERELRSGEAPSASSSSESRLGEASCFRAQLADLVPELKKRALRLTRDSARADDLLQDTVERALRFSDSFREGSHLRAWSMRIMQNVFVSQCRRSATERRVLEGAGGDPTGWARREPVQLRPGLSPPVERALDELPDRLRQVVDLVDLKEVSYRDAAALQRVPVGTIMSRLHRGRARLRNALGEAGEPEAADAGAAA